MEDGKVVQGAMNFNFEIFNTPSRGQGIKAKTFVTKGTSVLSSQPYAFVSRSELHGKICDNCLSPPGDSLQRCSACKMVYYCNQSCQKNAWGMHKLECKYLKKMSPIMPVDKVRLVALLLLKNDPANCLGDLVSHSDKIRQQKVFANMLEMLKQYLHGSMQRNSEAMFELLCKVNCNAFTIGDEVKPKGTKFCCY